MRKNKKAVALEFLFWLMLGLIVLTISILIIIILTGKGKSAIEFIKDLFKWFFIAVAYPCQINKYSRIIKKFTYYSKL